ncbi:B3 domain-containing protein At2g33720-like [Eucalyptus grandis]|uniref:B3 domain-containing protein At2g33720-like n=1 Tax=Eucalyptus grandis TaxID=71139 RepID=UPI00192EEC19|nr:B3 domain-containing protein At2g33720-like [Eucalyptus grandis]
MCWKLSKVKKLADYARAEPLAFVVLYKLTHKHTSSSPPSQTTLSTYRFVCAERKMPLDVSTELVLYRDPWEIKKKLTESDVNSSSRLLLPLDCLKAHVFPKMSEEKVRRVKSGDDVEVLVLDMDTDREHQLVFCLWKSGSYVLKSGWTQLFVRGLGLEVGDEIGMFWDEASCKFHFKVLHKVALGTSNAAA